jgi:hypothetical protein
MKERLFNYLVNEKTLSREKANDVINKLNAHTDLANEFYNWVCTRKFAEVPVIVKGDTAESLVQTTHLSVLGAYTYLIQSRSA